MFRSVLLAMAMLPVAVLAQTPAAERMPDGSHDLFAGLGVQAAPRYEGADGVRVRPLPVLQLAWSNGVFVAGASVGWHLSSSPTVEYGPLLAWQARRTGDGTGPQLGSVSTVARIALVDVVAPAPYRLQGIDPVPARLLGGGFINYYLTPQWRWTNKVLGGGGRDGNGVLWQLGLQRVGLADGHHSITMGASIDLANGAWNSSYSGVSEAEAAASGYAAWQAGAGLRAVHLAAHWNWTMSPSWLVASSIDASSLLDVARNSPLAARSAGLSVSTALAYRF